MTLKDVGWNIKNSYSDLPEIFFSRIKPNTVSSPELVVLNDRLAVDLGLKIEMLKQKESIDVFAGNKLLTGETFLSQAYGGHQFGHFTMLGDGRAVLVGEHITPSGKLFDIQLKGSGRTPYSRGGDGRASLGPMLREYIISEAIYNLGIPTTRSLAVVSTGEPVYRERPLPGAILTRVAKSHIRVGTFQYAATWGTENDVKALADYTINRHFTDIENEENPYISLLERVIELQASLIAKWQLVGFIHGVMNTDNVTISGETIDYGPCAFMDSYDPSTVFSSIDINGRYSYENQPKIGAWNLARFAETLLPLIHSDQDTSIKIAEQAINKYTNLYHNNWITGMRLKLGISNEEREDGVLIEGLLALMNKYKADFTNTFISLTSDNVGECDLFESAEFKDWNSKWNLRLKRQDRPVDISKEDMKNYNPIIIPRNHLVEKALAAAVQKVDYVLFKDLLKALSEPFNYDNIKEEYMAPPEKSGIPYKTFCGT